MEDNWYETAVSASAPHDIISVVDWASDAYAPVPKPPTSTGSTYNVFKWGVNDPSCGDRTIEKENFDLHAAPVGWHSMPYANDPSMKGTKVANRRDFRNTTTTWGNNVGVLFLSERQLSLSLYRSSLKRTGKARTPSSTTTVPMLVTPRPSTTSMTLRRLRRSMHWTRRRSTSTPLLPSSSTRPTLSTICTTGESIVFEQTQSIFTSPEPGTASTKCPVTSSSITLAAVAQRTTASSRTRRTVQDTTTQTS